MSFIADLHIHSRFSLATSKQLTVAHLAHWGARKGIHVLGTGDFTHPKWRAELARDLVFDEESGLYRPKQAAIPDASSENSPYFCLQAEISCIYKKNGKVRKIHNLLYAPDLETADKIAARLALIGNINSDGRPILGLDSHDLLEIALECSPECVLVPAHIWTPWFALFGSKSGFDRIEDCYGDLTDHIFALETGLSSDPPMNRYLSALDNFTLISNSDAHSGPNLGREANIFSGNPTYAGIFAALRLAAGREAQGNSDCRFLGTMEFYPEEGKYHLDGHRACNVVLSPAESRELGDICPVCGKPLTVGVLHRVMELADRAEPAQLPNAPEARMLVPLQEVICQIMEAGPASRKAKEKYDQALNALGPELDILCGIPEKDVYAWWEPLGEAVARIRKGQVILNPGYDGKYGVITIFTPEELKQFSYGKILPGAALAKSAPVSGYQRQPFIPAGAHSIPVQQNFVFSTAQLAAINAGSQPAFVLAGPGAGKTRVLVERILKLLQNGVDSQNILALTFTRRAAGEVKTRLAGSAARLPLCDTLHGLAYGLICERKKDCVLLDEEAAKRMFRRANPQLSARECRLAWQRISLARERLETFPAEDASAFSAYAREKTKGASPYLDYGDLLDWLLNNSGEFSGRWQYILVDEAQDLSALQLELLRKLLPANGQGFFGIGDPDQAIYGFRGALPDILANLRAIWPDLNLLRLQESYRSSQKILDMAHDSLGKVSANPLKSMRGLHADLKLYAADTELAEADWIAGKITNLLGGSSHSLTDARAPAQALSPGDIAVLTRLKSQIPPILKALQKSGVPCSAPAEEEFWHDGQCASILDLALERQPEESIEKFVKELAAAPEHHLHEELLPENESYGKLRALWHECGSWKNFFQQLAWLQEAERISAMGSTVQIMTLHAAKGLEFHTVFLPGMEKGLLPLDRQLLFAKKYADPVNIAEEARLLYVGITRARAGVCLSCCQTRRLYGRELSLEPSPWLPLLKKYCQTTRRVRHTRIKKEQLDLLPNWRK